MCKNILILHDGYIAEFASSFVDGLLGCALTSVKIESGFLNLNSESCFDLIILCIENPETDIANIINTIRSFEKLENTPVFLVTEGFKPIWYDELSDGYIATPINPVEIITYFQLLFKFRPNIQNLNEVDINSISRIDRFSSLCQETRAILNAITVSRALLAKVSIDNRNHYFVDIFNQGEANLIREMKEFFDFYRLGNSGVDMKNSHFYLDDAINQVVNMLRPVAKLKGLNIKVNAENISGFYFGDYAKIKCIIYNIVENAIKYTDEGEISVYGEKNEGAISVYVEDTGIGIEAGRLESIFNKFQMADEGGRVGEGIGLGLAISRTLASSMDAGLTVQSLLGRGSVFCLELPLGKQALHGC